MAKKKTPRRVRDLGKEAVWQKRYFALQGRIQDLFESGVKFKPEHDDIPALPFSVSREFFISHDMYVVDSESYALENWGEGKFFKVVRVD